MAHGAGFAVHQVMGADHLAAKRFTDGLMAEAHTEYRRLTGHVANEGDEDAGFAWGARTGREQNAVRPESLDFLDCQFVVAAHHDLRTQFAQVLNEVVGEGIVVVENEDHRAFKCSAWVRLRKVLILRQTQARVSRRIKRQEVARECRHLKN